MCKNPLKSSLKYDSQTPSPQIQYWDGAWKFAFLMVSQLRLVLLIFAPRLEEKWCRMHAEGSLRFFFFFLGVIILKRSRINHLKLCHFVILSWRQWSRFRNNFYFSPNYLKEFIQVVWPRKGAITTKNDLYEWPICVAGKTPPLIILWIILLPFEALGSYPIP